MKDKGEGPQLGGTQEEGTFREDGIKKGCFGLEMKDKMGGGEKR